MRRQVIMGAAVGLAAVVGLWIVVMASQQGWFGGKDRRWLAQAVRDAKLGRLDEAQAKLEDLIGAFPDSPWADDALLKLGDVYEAQQHLVEARAMYRLLLERFPDSSLISRTQERLGQVNISLLFSPIVTELDEVHQVQRGDTLGQIAAANGTTVEFLKRANGLTSDLIRPQQKLKVPKGRFTIVVDISQKQLLLTENNQFIKSYPVGTGKDSPTPEGTFTIVNKIPDPVWYKQGAVVPQGSPENILGTRWMGFDKAGYGIHGSIDSAPIAEQATAGCVRMTNSDVEELFAIVPLGTEVTIVN